MLSPAYSLKISELWRKKKRQNKDEYFCVLLLDVSVLLQQIPLSLFSEVVDPVVGLNLPPRTRKCPDYCLTTVLPGKVVSQTALFGFFFFFLDVSTLYLIHNASLTVFLYQLRNYNFNISCIFKDGLPDFSAVGFVCIYYTSPLFFLQASCCIFLDALPIQWLSCSRHHHSNYVLTRQT